MTHTTDQNDSDDATGKPPKREASDDSKPGSATNAGGDQDDEDKSQPQRKERVLHTRVPAVLEQELKRLAQSLRMPVSNVVRAILEDAVTAVDMVGRKAEGEMNRVVDRMAEKRERLRDIATGPKGKADADEPLEHEAPTGQPEAPASDALATQPTASSSDAAKQLEGIIGFQPLLLAASTSCSVCGIDLKAGSEAFVGVRDVPGPRVLIGPECLPKPEDEP